MDIAIATARNCVIALITIGLLAPVPGYAQDARKEAAASMYTLAKSEFTAGRYPEALDKLLEVYELDPNPVILYNIGRCYEEVGQLAEAAEYFQRAASDSALPEGLYVEIGKRLPLLLPALNQRQTHALAHKSVARSLLRSEEVALKTFVDQQKGEPAPVTVQAQAPADNSGLFLWSGVAIGGVGLGSIVGKSCEDT